jgi:hypothetical protein
MAVRKESHIGEIVSKELRKSITEQVKEHTGLDLPSTQTLDQMIRMAAKHGVRFNLVSHMA